ncbi:hypothetical protein [Streptomyces sp. bgisy153]|uniref:hypothetical protein n=1 Tax=Streptomyces sp. bgisy153 TaxID=3413793 RepID=UPI003D7542EB
MSTVRRRPRSRSWLRVLVLLLALLVPGGQPYAPPVAEGAVEVVEYDALGVPAPRPAAHRAAAPLRPAPDPAPAPGGTGFPAAAGPGPTPRTPRLLRTVVLRC